MREGDTSALLSVEDQRRLAVLIDADNAQPSVIEKLLALEWWNYQADSLIGIQFDQVDVAIEQAGQWCVVEQGARRSPGQPARRQYGEPAGAGCGNAGGIDTVNVSGAHVSPERVEAADCLAKIICLAG